jgi:hypothetical protein
MFNNFILNRTVFEVMWKNILEPDRSRDNMVHEHCMLDT